uniref:Uncharacterized protein n=1 Tax=Amphimedon queenslandica TaxID=400682 RepID=A0A1X7UKG1_AMPQE
MHLNCTIPTRSEHLSSSIDINAEMQHSCAHEVEESSDFIETISVFVEDETVQSTDKTMKCALKRLKKRMCHL